MAGITAVLCVRNEGAFLLDWLAHHLCCGISHVVAVSNDCADGTDAMLDRLAALGSVTHLRNPAPHGRGGIQFTGLKRADQCPAVREAEWLIALDVDEFVNVHVGARDLQALIAALPGADAIPLTWRVFGNAGQQHYEDLPVTAQFTRAAPAVLYWPWRAALFKTLYRNDGAYRNLGVHRPRQLRAGRAPRWMDTEGRTLDRSFRDGRLFSHYGAPMYRLAQLNHYPLGAMESFVLKADRGRAVHAAEPLGLDYWVERNFDAEEDRSVLALSEAVSTRRAELAADPQLAALHAAAVDWRRARFEVLMRQERYRDLFGRLMMAPPARVLTRQDAEGILRHAQG